MTSIPTPIRPERTRARTISIEHSRWKFAKRLGSGNVSLGVKIALEVARQNPEQCKEAKNPEEHTDTLQL